MKLLRLIMGGGGLEDDYVINEIKVLKNTIFYSEFDQFQKR